MSPPEPAGTIVVATRNRADVLAGTLERLTTLPERWPVVVVDDASTDGTTAMVKERFPQVRALRSARQMGACARNLGVQAASTEVVAFADDDSWWAPGALARAAEHLEAHTDVGLLAARCIVEPEGSPDPVSRAQEASPLPSAPPGPSVLGFLACAAVVRRSAFLRVGGFHRVIGFVGEEEVLALDLRAAAWRVVHTPDVVAHHQPGLATTGRGPRRILELRNDVLTHWLRRPLRTALSATGDLARRAVVDATARSALAETLLRLPSALADRRPVPADLESDIRTLEGASP